MNFLTTIDVCGGTELDPVWEIVGLIIKIIWIGIPILLIVLGMFDLGKAVIASKEDEVKKATKAFGKRFLYAVLVFAVVWIVTIVLNLVSNLSKTSDIVDPNASDWRACWCKISKGTDHGLDTKGSCVKK